jgi:hypothetical protein
MSEQAHFIQAEENNQTQHSGPKKKANAHKLHTYVQITKPRVTTIPAAKPACSVIHVTNEQYHTQP